MTRRAVPLSVLDLAPVPSGSTGADALRSAVDRARLVERLGYRRVWYAEHHLAAGVASSTPGVLAALTASATSTIRVGSAAVLLGSTSPVVAAEQFGTVAALHPGRVDLGLGRASFPPPSKEGPPAPRPRVAPTEARVVDGLLVPAAPPLNYADPDPALRARFAAHLEFLGAGRTPAPFRDELATVLALQAGTATAGDRGVTSPAVEGSDVALWVLASSAGESARVAGELGLPLAANYHVSPATVLDTVEAYRAAFVPGVLDEPYVVVSADVLVAETEAARRRARRPVRASGCSPSARASARSRTRGPARPRRSSCATRPSRRCCATGWTPGSSATRTPWSAGSTRSCARPAPTSSSSPPSRTTRRTRPARTSCSPAPGASPTTSWSAPWRRRAPARAPGRPHSKGS